MVELRAGSEDDVAERYGRAYLIPSVARKTEVFARNFVSLDTAKTN